MQRPKDLSRDELERIVNELQQALYLRYDEEADEFLWDPAKEWSGFDVCDAMGDVLGELSMVPEEVKPFE
ncbi:hypothetical protein [Lacipirellula parvula]|uniref:Uncharacterized protein n=1 Tax=Lacipirellula parvula TaxID=2650471 RepID=A0A5K7XJN0_9BACT|nr:hypothetical protein [Lacipirellula parvula]BBO34443.1 hypothetical protein PLANPX_4055 [Lacipirellula parvula]